MNELINQQREQIAQLMAERDALAAQLVDAFGDGYYDGFLDGAKHHEQTDCNTGPQYLGEDAMRCSEIAEGEKSKRLGIVGRQALAAQVEVLQSEIVGLVSTVFKTSKALIEATETLERELLPALEDSEPLIELIEEFKSVIAATPQHHLAEIRAQAGLDFAKYIDATGELNFGDSNFVLEEAAQYAESILNGELK